MSIELGLAYPVALALLALLPLYFRSRRRWLRRDAVAFAPLQYRAGAPRRRRLAQRLQLPIELLLLASLVVALAGPYRETQLDIIEDEGIDVALVLDVSLSMLADDFPPPGSMRRGASSATSFVAAAVAASESSSSPVTASFSRR